MEKLQERRKIQSYRDLEIYQESHALGLEIHKISLKLSPYELYETGSISSESYHAMKGRYEILSRKIHVFIKSVERGNGK